MAGLFEEAGIAMNDVRAVAATYRGNDYGIRWAPCWPHVSLGLSAHLSSRFGHLSIHLPVGLLIVGCLGSATGEGSS